MTNNENYREESNNIHLLLCVLLFVGVALLPVVLAVVQRILA